MDVVEARLQALFMIREKLKLGDKLEDHLSRADMLATWLISGAPPASPGPVTNEARAAPGMDFGNALFFLKMGRRVTRAGWNGAGMFAYLVPAASYPAQTGAAKAYYGEGAQVPYRAYLALKTAQGDVATWSPSCTDVLAEDWAILPPD